MCKCIGDKCIYTSMTHFKMKKEKYAIGIANMNTWYFEHVTYQKINKI
jgi:hypothetical protein